MAERRKVGDSADSDQIEQVLGFDRRFALILCPSRLDQRICQFVSDADPCQHFLGVIAARLLWINHGVRMRLTAWAIPRILKGSPVGESPVRKAFALAGSV